jgi:hypothetical protein
MDSRSRAPSVPRLLRTVVVGAFAGALVSLAPPPARAQSAPTTQTAQDRASARVLAEDADKKMTSGDYAGAIESLTKAYALVSAPTIKVARAHAYLKLARLIEAQQDLLDAARSESRPGEPGSWADARQRARAEAETITPRLPLLTLGVTGAPLDRVTFTVDGQTVATATLGSPRALNPGAHAVKADADGFVSSEQSVTLGEGEHKAVTFALSPAPGGASAGVTSSPEQAPFGSATAADQGQGQGQGQEPSGAQPSPAPGYAPIQMTSLPRQPEPNNTVSTLGWAGAGVFGGTGLVTGVVAFVQANEVKSHCTGNVCPTSSQGEANTSSTLGNVATVSLIVAGGCLLLGILTHHSAPRQVGAATAETKPSFDLFFGPGSLGAVGRF